MKFVFYTNSVSPHQLPLARELINRLGAENYVDTQPLSVMGYVDIEQIGAMEKP